MAIIPQVKVAYAEQQAELAINVKPHLVLV